MFTRSSLRFLSVFIIFLFTLSCQKDSNIQTADMKQPDQTGLSAVSIGADGLMTFKDLESFGQVYQALKASEPKDLMNWQQQIGFLSVNYHFEQVWSDLCCDTNHEDIVNSASRYPYVNITPDGDIKPLIRAGLLGWIINETGQFRIGKSLVMITDAAIISVIDGDANKAALAARTLEENVAEGILVRFQDPQFGLRACCPSFGIGTGTITVESRRIKDANMGLADRSFAASVPVGLDIFGNVIYATAYTIIYEMDYFFHHQRRTFFGWTVCERTNWRFSSNWNLIHNVPTSLGAPASPIIGSISNFTTGFECKYNRTDGIMYVPFVSPSVYAGAGITCVDRLQLNVEAQSSGITGSAICGQ